MISQLVKGAGLGTTEFPAFRGLEKAAMLQRNNKEHCGPEGAIEEDRWPTHYPMCGLRELLTSHGGQKVLQTTPQTCGLA